MIRKNIILTIAALILTIVMFSQEAENNEITNKSNELGMHAGFTTGLGLSFRHWENKYGIQITAIPIKTDYEQFISAAITGLYSFSKKKYTRFYLYLGNHVIIDDSYYNNDTGLNETRTKYNIGFGTGFEVGKNVKFTVMAGYGAYDITSSSYMLLPTAEIGLYFKLRN